MQDETYIDYEEKIRAGQSQFIDDIKSLREADIQVKELKKEKINYNLLNTTKIYYDLTKKNLEKADELLLTLESIDDEKEMVVTKAIYSEIYTIAALKFKEWERMYAQEVRLSDLTKYTKGGALLGTRIIRTTK
jgi:hypothetical protein